MESLSDSFRIRLVNTVRLAAFLDVINNMHVGWIKAVSSGQAINLVAVGFNVDVIVRHIGRLQSNAPAKLRRARAAAIPPPTSRAPSASAGCYAVPETCARYPGFSKTSTRSRTMRREQQFR